MKSRTCRISHWVVVVSCLFVVFHCPALGASQTGVGKTDENRQDGIAKRIKGNVLRFGIDAGDVGTLDPHFAAGSQERALADMMFNGLVRFRPGNAPVVEADLAEEIPAPQMRHGKQIWTFRLRRGVMFHPGPRNENWEMTADDVVWSLNKSADHGRSAYSGEYTGMAVEKADRHTVRIILEKPLSAHLFLPKLCDYGGGFIVSQKAVESMGYEGFISHPIGTGPFMFDARSPGEKVSLKAHPSYFRGRPKLDGVDVFFVPDPAKAKVRFIAGELDVLETAFDDVAGTWRKKSGIRIDIHGLPEVAVLYFNLAAKPLDDHRVRRAIVHGLDRDAFLYNRDMVKPAFSLMPPEVMPGGLSREEMKLVGADCPFDPSKAEKLLARAGYPEGFSLDLTVSEMTVYRKAYTILKTQLARIKIDLNLHITDHSTMHRIIRQGKNPMVIYIAWRPNADVYLTRFFHSKSIVVDGEKPDTNFSHYREIDHIIEGARQEIDPDKQVSLWKQAQIMILKDMAAWPLFHINVPHIRRAEVDYGHPLENSLAAYPQFTEKTRFADQ